MGIGLLFASGTAVLSSMSDLQINGAVSTCFGKLEEQNALTRKDAEESAQTYALQVADALQAEVEQVQVLLAPDRLEKVEELQRVLGEQLCAGADAALN